MTIILAIETSTDACSVALSSGPDTFYRFAQEPRSHTQLVMPMVNEVLSDAKIGASAIDVIGVSIGPGYFTGLRIGFAVTQGLAFGLNLPVIGVSSLEIMVATYLRQHPSLAQQMEHGDKIVSVLDARMGEYNCGCYWIDSNGQIFSEHTDILLSRSDALAWIQTLQPTAVIGETKKLFTETSIWKNSIAEIHPEAIDLLEITNSRHADGQALSIKDIELVYLRGTDAWQKRTRLRDKKNG
jgi:tRNA threonylcarbamoyladenosine biosynthesis protein TsaB